MAAEATLQLEAHPVNDEISALEHHSKLRDKCVLREKVMLDSRNPVLGSGGPRHIQFGLKLAF